MPHAIVPAPRLRRDRPISLVLGAGGVRGLAHVGVLQVLSDRGFHVTEMTGTSVGALIIAFYAAVGAGVGAYSGRCRPDQCSHCCFRSSRAIQW